MDAKSGSCCCDSTSGVNADPAAYGFVGSSNITGVLEHEHFVETVKLLREMFPQVTRIAVIVDGMLRQVGTAKQIKSKPADETVRAFLQELPQ